MMVYFQDYCHKKILSASVQEFSDGKGGFLVNKDSHHCLDISRKKGVFWNWTTMTVPFCSGENASCIS